VHAHTVWSLLQIFSINAKSVEAEYYGERRRLIVKRKSVLLLLLLFSFLCVRSNLVKIGIPDVHAVCSIDTNAEYRNGTIPGDPLDVWYAWINVSNTQVVYYAFVSDEVNPPVKNFLGQHFQIENETDVFIGNTLALIEVYNDTNKDGIPQANFTSGESEIAYYLEVNSSVSYEITLIQRVIEEEIAHYKWGFRYNIIDGFLQYPDQGNTGARVMIECLGFNYDFYMVGNTSYMKMSFDIGNITDIEPWWGEPPISLENLSLSLLFSTVTSSAKQHTAYVNGEPYDSTDTTDSATAISGGEIAVETIKAYEFLFGENYNLTRGESIETHTTKSEAAATTSVPKEAQPRLDWGFSYFENYLNLSELFPSAVGIGGKVSLDYNISKFLYRICYPVWDGLPIKHDPTLVAYLFSNTTIPEFPSLLILPLSMIATLFAALVYGKKIFYFS